MFGLRKKGPTRPFTHADDCPIVRADPSAKIEWSEVERGHWQAIWQCGSEHFHEQAADRHTGSTPMTRPPSATRASASTVPRPILLSSGSS
jgi:hypothetical protein